MVLFGVVLTIRSNHRRAVFERLEQRAKDRELTLQAHYASFATAGYGVMAAAGSLRACKISRQQVDSGQLRLDQRQMEERLAYTRRLFDDSTTTASRSLAEARCAFSAIVLLDEDQKRIIQARELLLSLYQLPNKDEDGSIGLKVERQFEEFLGRVGVQLQHEYVAGLDLAKRGQPYVRAGRAT
ncbi:MAG: hypothetical protein WD749_15320 [Phycisphaerales bacterium]